MAATVEYYEQLLDALPDTESLTVVVVVGKSRGEVAGLLSVDLSDPVDDAWPDDDSKTGWAVSDIPGGVLAFEFSGYGDPAVQVLRALSVGGAASVVRGNVQAHVRFGAARDGELLFDDDEYMFTENPDSVPAELRPLFELIYDDLEGDESSEDGPDGFTVGLAMAEVVTGIELNAESTEAAANSGMFAGPSLVYRRED